MVLEKRIVILVLIPLVLSVLFMVFVHRSPTESDGLEYDVLAKNIVGGKGYSLDGVTPYGFRPPLYSMFVAFIYFLFGPHPYAVVFFQILFLMAVPPVIRKTLDAAGFGESQAFFGALAVASYPWGYIYSQQLLTEPMTTLLFAIASYFAVLIWREKLSGFAKLTLCGMIITLPAMMKSQHISLVCGLFLALFLSFVFRKAGWKKVAAKAVPLALGAFLLLAPWGARNYYHFHKASILGEGAFGEGFLKGYYHAKGEWLIWRYWNVESPTRGPHFEEWDGKMKLADQMSAKSGMNLGDAKAKLAVEEIKAHPFEAFRGWVVRVYSLWIALPKGSGYEAMALVFLLEMFFLAFAAAGLFVYRKQLFTEMTPVYLCILAESLLLPIIDVESRYSITLKPYIALAVGLLAFKMLYRNRNTEK